MKDLALFSDCSVILRPELVLFNNLLESKEPLLTGKVIVILNKLLSVNNNYPSLLNEK